MHPRVAKLAIGCFEYHRRNVPSIMDQHGSPSVVWLLLVNHQYFTNARLRSKCFEDGNVHFSPTILLSFVDMRHGTYELVVSCDTFAISFFRNCMKSQCICRLALARVII
jgi:hypothetical protein